MMRKIKIAQIGTSRNSHGEGIFESLKKQNDLFEIIGYALPEKEREKFPERMGVFEGFEQLSVEEILNNPEIEAVSVETEEQYPTKYALLAAERGKHIHMEKPGGVSLCEFEKLIELVKKNHRVFHTGYMYRYNPYIMQLMKKVKSGELGEIISVEAQMNCYHSYAVRQWLKSFPGGMMFFLGCHLIDLILQIQGKPESILPFNKCSGIDHAEGKDVTMAVLEYKNGVSFAKTSAVEVGGFARRQLVVSGTKGTIEINPLEMVTEGGLYTVMTEYKAADKWHDRGNTMQSGVYDRYDAMMASFAAMVRGEKQNPWGYDYELELYKTILTCCGGEKDVY